MVELEGFQQSGATEVACMDGEEPMKEEAHESFDTMNLHEDLLTGIYASGLDKPSPVQQRCIVPFCEGRHIVLQAQPGSGVRDMFSIGILQQLDYSISSCQALVLAPNRDLVPSIVKKLRTFGEYLKVKVHPCIGGTNVREDQRILESAVVHVVIGTCGRVRDLLRRRLGDRLTNQIKIVVLYNADDMMSDDKSIQEVHAILKHLPSNIQVGISSAFTTPAVLTKLAQELMHKPLFVTVKLHLPKDLKHFCVKVMGEWEKLDTLCHLFRALANKKCVVLVNGRNRVHGLASKMLARGHVVSAVHGGMKQDIAMVGMHEFMWGSSNILITPNLPSDMPEGCLIVQYDVPKQPEYYISSIFGRRGVAISFVAKGEEWSIENIQRLGNMVFQELPSNVETLI